MWNLLHLVLGYWLDVRSVNFMKVQLLDLALKILSVDPNQGINVKEEELLLLHTYYPSGNYKTKSINCVRDAILKQGVFTK